MFKAIKYAIKWIEWKCKDFLAFLFKRLFINHVMKKGNYKDIPVYIISFNRYTYLKQTVEWLEDKGYNNITIIDNHSDYAPLVEYLKNSQHKVIFMKKNYGYKVFDKSFRFLFKRYFHFYYLTDPDLTPIKDCPDDFGEMFFKVLKQHYFHSKVGFSLKIDDLPDGYPLKNDVIDHESQFYEHPLSNNLGFEVFEAGLDTTFALNSPHLFVARLKRLPRCIRTGVPYQVRHLPWYMVEANEENEQYVKTLRNDTTTWNGNFSSEELKKMQNRS